jgi:meiotically up-regulated gene 157 (Mug157) protein
MPLAATGATRTPLWWALSDQTQMRPGVAERKWEVDSLCHVVRLAYGYWRATGDSAPFDAQWHQAARLIVFTLRTEQRRDGTSPYRFQRSTPVRPTACRWAGWDRLRARSG